jgi:hypothetical protein
MLMSVQTAGAAPGPISLLCRGTQEVPSGGTTVTGEITARLVIDTSARTFTLAGLAHGNGAGRLIVVNDTFIEGLLQDESASRRTGTQFQRISVNRLTGQLMYAGDWTAPGQAGKAMSVHFFGVCSVGNPVF